MGSPRNRVMQYPVARPVTIERAEETIFWTRVEARSVANIWAGSSSWLCCGRQAGPVNLEMELVGSVNRYKCITDFVIILSLIRPIDWTEAFHPLLAVPHTIDKSKQTQAQKVFATLSSKWTHISHCCCFFLCWRCRPQQHKVIGGRWRMMCKRMWLVTASTTTPKLASVQLSSTLGLLWMQPNQVTIFFGF